MEEQINHAKSKEAISNMKTEILSTKNSNNQIPNKEKNELLFTKEISNSAEDRASEITHSAKKEKVKRGTNSQSRTKPNPKKRQSAKVKPADGAKIKERRKTPLKAPKNKTQVANEASDNNGDSTQVQEVGSAVTAVGLLENKPKNDSSANKNSETKMNQLNVPVKRMPKLIKPSFNPPSLKINNQYAPKKMPKLVKPRFVSPAFNKLSDSKEKEESSKKQSELTLKENKVDKASSQPTGDQGREESSEGCSDSTRKRKEKEDEDSQIELKRPKKKTRKITDSDEEENEKKDAENRGKKTTRRTALIYTS